jgi:hypothetical protein
MSTPHDSAHVDVVIGVEDEPVEAVEHGLVLGNDLIKVATSSVVHDDILDSLSYAVGSRDSLRDSLSRLHLRWFERGRAVD